MMDANVKLSPRKYGKTVTRNVLVRDAIARLRDVGIPDAAESTEWLATEAFECSRTELWSESDVAVDAAQVERFETMLARRLLREPVQYIVGYTEFYGFRFDVDSNVLIPRPETERVVERGLELIAGIERARVLDIGTGSGCIAVTTKLKARDADVVACDVSNAALEMARSNARRLSAEVNFVECDVLTSTFSDIVGHGFDLVVSNPPYIPSHDRTETMPEVRDFEPHEALFVEDDPVLFYRAIARQADAVLAPSGIVVVEIHEEYGVQVEQVFAQNGFQNIQTELDLSGRPRLIRATR